MAEAGEQLAAVTTLKAQVAELSSRMQVLLQLLAWERQPPNLFARPAQCNSLHAQPSLGPCLLTWFHPCMHVRGPAVGSLGC